MYKQALHSHEKKCQENCPQRHERTLSKWQIMEKEKYVDYYGDFEKSEREKSEKVRDAIINTDRKTGWILFWTMVLVVLTLILLFR